MCDDVNSISLADGQFAVACADRARDHCWLEVDLLGAARLFYAIRKGVVLFADDLAHLLAMLGDSPGVCPRSLDAYFTLLQIPAPLTGLEGIHQVPPNTRVILADGRITPTVAWSPSTDDHGRGLDLASAVEAAVGGAAGSGSSVGLLFSGGIDSSVLGAVLAASPARVGVTAHALGEPGSQEVRIARARAEILSLPFREWPVAELGSTPVHVVTRRWQAPVFSFLVPFIDHFVRSVGAVDRMLITGAGADGVFGTGVGGRGVSPPVLGSRAPMRGAIEMTRPYRAMKRFARRHLYGDPLRAVGGEAPEAVIVERHLRHSDRSPEAADVFQYLALSHPTVVAAFCRAVDEGTVVHFPFLTKPVLSVAMRLRAHWDVGGGGHHKPALESLLRGRVPQFPVSGPRRGFGHSIALRRRFLPAFVPSWRDRVMASRLASEGWLRPDALRTVFDGCATDRCDPQLLRLGWALHSLAVWCEEYVATNTTRAQS